MNGSVLSGLEPAHDFEAVDARHHHVEQDQIGRCVRRRDARACSPSIAVSMAVATRLEARPQQLDVVFVIVDDQDSCGYVTTHCRARGTAVPRRLPLAAHTVSRDTRRSRPPSLSRDPTRVRAP